MKILTIKNRKDNEFLRRKAPPFNFEKFTKKEIQELIKKMNSAMAKSEGIGLAANQVGLDLRFFIARVDRKFYAIFNPQIVKNSEDNSMAAEGCLSVPQIVAYVPRPSRITLESYDRYGKKVKIKAWGVLARVFQHEVDHLNGKLFIDRIKKK